MGFRSNMPYAMNTQLQQRVDDKQTRDKAAFAHLDRTALENPAGKIEWANGLGNNIDGKYQPHQLSDELRYSEANVTDRDRTGMSYQNAARNRDIIQSQQDLLTYGPAGKPNITNNNMNNTQDSNLIDPANVGESGQLNTFSDPTRQVAAQTYGGELEKTAAMSPLGMKIDPSAAYNAMDALKSVQNLNLNQGGKTNYRRDTDDVYKSVGLPGLPTSSTGGGTSGSYSDSASTITPPASTTPKYSFLTDQNTPTFDKSKLDNPQHRMSFLGLHKRNKPSLEARIKDATDDGKTRKVARLNKKLDNFNDYQSGGKGFVGRALQGIGNIFK